MAKIQEKELLVSEIKEKMDASEGFILYDYRGLTVQEVTQLRNEFRAAGVEYKVLKNTMLERAAKLSNLEGLVPYLNGPTAVAFGVKDAVAPAKVLTAYVKKIKKTEIKCGVVGGKVIDVKGVQALSELPPKDVLIAKMLGSMNAPISGLVTVLGGTLRSLLYAINAIKEKKEAV